MSSVQVVRDRRLILMLLSPKYTFQLLAVIKTPKQFHLSGLLSFESHLAHSTGQTTLLYIILSLNNQDHFIENMYKTGNLRYK